MQNSIKKLSNWAIAIFIFIACNANAQFIKDLPLGQHGGHVFTTSVNNHKVECKVNDNNIELFVVDAANKDAQLKVAAATANVLFDYDGKQEPIIKTITITSKNKFIVDLPKSEYKLNFIAAQFNFNGNLFESRYVVNKANSGSTSTVE
ncbi:MAG: hypothetical protein JNK61_08605 [Bacteroidia bacterium]|nr:hypothetical protein [Bacteroidia bacterium]HQV00458.1 hypothetical protein [Bacteroidia bacterium]